jgi:hypothetical protein
MRDKRSKDTGSNNITGHTGDTWHNNRDGSTVSGIDRTDLQYITGHKCHGLYMDSPNGLVNYIRLRDHINNSNNRHIRTEWKYNSNSIQQLRD